MKNRMRALALLLLMAGCAPAFAPGLAALADRSLTFEQFLSDPDLYSGKILILGGEIDQFTLHPQGTLLLIIHRPLDYWDQPRRTERTGGRFQLFIPRPLDALVYAPGREITAVAEVAGTRLPLFGERTFDDPVLVVKDLRLWQKRARARTTPTWGDPLYDRYGQPGRPE